MKFSLIFISIILSMNYSYTQSKLKNNDIIFLWPNEVPGELEPKHPAIQTSNVSNNVKRITNVTNPNLTVFLPEENKNNGSSIIICPGGGYQILAIDLEGYEIAKWLTKLGYTAFVLEYRVPQKQEGALMDVQRALKIVRSNSKKWNLDPNKIGVLGFSAGAGLSARISTNYSKETYSKIDYSDEFSSMPNFTILIYPAYLDKGENNSLSSELVLSKKTPPMFLFATADDPYANSALVMASALRENKTPVELHLYPTGGHGYGLRPGKDAALKWPILVENWLNQLLK